MDEGHNNENKNRYVNKNINIIQHKENMAPMHIQNEMPKYTTMFQRRILVATQRAIFRKCLEMF